MPNRDKFPLRTASPLTGVGKMLSSARDESGNALCPVSRFAATRNSLEQTT